MNGILCVALHSDSVYMVASVRRLAYVTSCVVLVTAPLIDHMTSNVNEDCFSMAIVNSQSNFISIEVYAWLFTVIALETNPVATLGGPISAVNEIYMYLLYYIGHCLCNIVIITIWRHWCNDVMFWQNESKKCPLVIENWINAYTCKWLLSLKHISRVIYNAIHII